MADVRSCGPGFARRLGLWLTLVCAAPMSPVATLAQDGGTAKILEACRAIADSAARLRCFEDAAARLNQNTAPLKDTKAPPAAQGPGGMGG